MADGSIYTGDAVGGARPEADADANAALLAEIIAESQLSIGFDTDELSAAREKSLKYYYGEVPDLPALPNRSTAVSTDVADAIDTLLPDLVEIFAGDGEDVLAFTPLGEEDEGAAQQETDYVKHVIFNENPGWLIIFAMAKDALQVKTGVVKFWAEDCPPETETLEGVTAIGVEMAVAGGSELVDMEPAGMDGEEPLFNVTLRKPTYQRIKIAPVPPEDFSVGRDTTNLSGATYCKMRSRPRVQELLAEGFDPELVANLSRYSLAADEEVSRARDTIGEGDEIVDGVGDLEQVEIIEHVIRKLGPSGPVFWSVVTDASETTILRKEELDGVPFAAITPYLVTHRFHGESVADRLIPTQKISTSLMRVALDSAYFAMNQRVEVATDGANENTIPDLLNNIPGAPVRVKRTGTVTPISAGSINFDVFGALEFMQTKAEQRTGIVRAAQGLTPDTLHETAKGALALLTASQKRVRLIGRVFAETGIKDLYLGVHRLLRKHGAKAGAVRLRNKWVEVDPTTWGARSDMAIEVGGGASAREAELQSLNQEMGAMQQIIALQGGQPNGPIVFWEHVYNLYRRIFEKLGNKAPEKYGRDPREVEAEKAGKPPEPPPPDPKMVAVQMKGELDAAQAQQSHALKEQEAEADLALKMRKLELDAEVAQHRNTLEIAEQARVADAELALKREQLAAEIDLKRELAVGQAALEMVAGNAPGLEPDPGDALPPIDAELSNVHLGGDAG